MSSPIRVMVVDDHLLIREGIRHLLTVHTDMALVAEASAGSEILPLVELHRPHVLLLDLRLPVRPGAVETCFNVTSALTQMQCQYRDMRVIVISQHDSGLLTRSVLRAGVQGYLLKDDALTAHLVEAIRAVMAGIHFFSERIRHLLDEDREPLTERQIEILARLAAQPHLSRDVVAAQLGISANTLSDHLRKIFRALGVHNLQAALVKAIQMGLLPADATHLPVEKG